MAAVYIVRVVARTMAAAAATRPPHRLKASRRRRARESGDSSRLARIQIVTITHANQLLGRRPANPFPPPLPPTRLAGWQWRPGVYYYRRRRALIITVAVCAILRARRARAAASGTFAISPPVPSISSRLGAAAASLPARRRPLTCRFATWRRATYHHHRLKLRATR